MNLHAKAETVSRHSGRSGASHAGADGAWGDRGEGDPARPHLTNQGAVLIKVLSFH